MNLQIIVKESSLLNTDINEVFKNMFEFNKNKTLLIWPHDMENHKEDCKHYKILYPIASVLNECKIPFKVIVFNTDSKYNEYINNHDSDSFNVFISKIHITNAEEEYLEISNEQIKNTLSFDLYLKKESNNFHLVFQQKLDEYINK